VVLVAKKQHLAKNNSVARSRYKRDRKMGRGNKNCENDRGLIFDDQSNALPDNTPPRLDSDLL
jgi:hypothetical protein